MKKGKSITLLTIICVLMAILFFFTFARFDVGVKKYNSVLGAIETEYDISGGTAYTLTLAHDNLKEVSDINSVTDTISNRLKALGYNVFKVSAYKDVDKDIKNYNIRIEVKAPTNSYGEPNNTALESDINVVTSYGKLKFYGGSSSNPTDEIMSDIKVIDDASYAGTYNSGSSTSYQVSIQFTTEAYNYIQDKIKAGSFYLKINLGENTLLSGKDALSASYFNKKSIQISSNSEAGAKQLALQIKYGALDYKYDVSDGESISSPYGENVELISIISIASILILAVILFAIKYKGFSIVAFLSLSLFIVLELWMLILVPGIKISLGSIIGIAFASIFAIDGLIVTFKRIDEEHEKGKTTKFSICIGLKRALKPIFATAIICIVLSISLFFLTSGILKGFAITFGIGSLVSLISSLLFTRLFISLLLPIVKNKENFFKLKEPLNSVSIETSTKEAN